METKLHLIANEPGTFKGFSANYSGAGFTGMKFNAIATPTEADFDKWVSKVKSENNSLTKASYDELALPSEYHPVTYYGNVDDGLFHTIIMKYMQAHGDMNVAMPEHSDHAEHSKHSGGEE